MALLDKKEIEDRILSLAGWDYRKNSLVKDFVLDDFNAAIDFTVRVGIEAEKMDHHPDILIHSWNKINVKISTHSEGGVTENDFALAYAINKLV